MSTPLVILLLIANILDVKCVIDMNGLEMTERSQISRFRNFHDFVQFDESLMVMAKQEAQRLMQIGRLEKPQFKLQRNYAGHSKKVTGKLFDEVQGLKWQGYKMCFNSIFPNDYQIYDEINYNCDNLNLIFEKYYAVGFGIAIDYQNDIAYVVRLFLTNQAPSNSGQSKQQLSQTNNAYNQWGTQTKQNQWSQSVTPYNQWSTNNWWSSSTNWNQWQTTTQWMPASTQWNQWATTQNYWQNGNSKLDKLKSYLNGRYLRSLFNLNKKF